MSHLLPIILYIQITSNDSISVETKNSIVTKCQIAFNTPDFTLQYITLTIYYIVKDIFR